MNTDNLIRLWHHAAHCVEQRFGLTCPEEEPEPIAVQNPAENQPVWDVSVSTGKILYPENTSLSNTLLPAVLAREACRISLPSSIRDNRARLDIACEYGRQVVKDSTVDEWVSLWKRDSPRTILPNGTNYRPQILFQTLWHLGEEAALNELITRLSRMDKHEIVLTFKDWVESLLRYVIEYERPLTGTEMSVVDVLLANPDADRRRIADRADISPRWASTVCRNLKKRGQLMEFDVVVYSKIGIRVFQVMLLAPSDDQKDCSYLLEGCPFVFSSSSVLTGGRGVYATLCIPDNPKNISHLDKLAKAAKNHGFSVFIFERHKSGSWLNLNDYEPNSGAWSLDWESVRLEGQMMQREDLSLLYPEIHLSGPTKERKLDEIDIRLLSEFEKGNKTARSLQNALGIRMNTVLRRLNELRDDDIIRKSWEVHHIGLTEEGIVFTEDETAANCTAALALRLPRCFLDYDREDRLFLRTRLPSGGVFGLAHALEPIKSLSGVHLIGDRIWGRWHLSNWLEKWDEKSGRWRPTTRDLSSWYSSMESSPETRS